jgi:glycosyltransferase involved in cell wall biosynthesis
MNKISIVITSFNRIALIGAAIDSALIFIEEFGEGEIIIVDDHSVDGSVEYLSLKYKSEIYSGRILLIQHQKNLGVTGAKNSGAKAAAGNWIMFLDSDDKLQPGVALKMKTIIHKVPESCPVVFFRCVNEEGELIGPQVSEEYWLKLPEFLRRGTPGECLPVVRRLHFSRFKYDEDLRGFEGLTYGKMIREFGPSLICPIVARIYSTGNNDRLSTRENIRKRGCLIALGYARMLLIFLPVLGINGFLLIGGKGAAHFLRCIYSRVTT